MYHRMARCAFKRQITVVAVSACSQRWSVTKTINSLLQVEVQIEHFDNPDKYADSPPPYDLTESSLEDSLRSPSKVSSLSSISSDSLEEAADRESPMLDSKLVSEIEVLNNNSNQIDKIPSAITTEEDLLSVQNPPSFLINFRKTIEVRWCSLS